jgi:1-deoxy-D-xylulose-5-phosphate synthase
MHRVFDSPRDKFIFDVGHQAYTHKILTGRAKDFPTLRMYQGLSGFPKRSESSHDVWETGHSSTSISAAAGFVYARDYQKEDYHVVGLIGDGALTGGMSFEALNHLGEANKRVIIILNDNKMSISENVGAMTNILNRVRLNKKYNKVKTASMSFFHKKKHVFSLMKRMRDGAKSFFLHNNIFEELGFEYFGPFDGHNLPVLISAFESAKTMNKPVFIHVITKKGKGYQPAEADTIGNWHGCGPFEIETGKFLGNTQKNQMSWSKIISEIVTRLALDDERIVAITPAMKTGSALDVFEKVFPDRLIDVGIAEQHALTFAGGLVASGMKPFVAIYSTFLQRAYDQLSHDLARQELPVVIGIDRSGLVNGDGDTHQGIYDIALVRHIPHLTLMMPKDAYEAYDLLYTAFRSNRLSLIRYPRGNADVSLLDDYLPKEVIYGTWTKENFGDEVIFIAYGPSLTYLREIIVKQQIQAILVNARFIKPIDEAMLIELIENNRPIIVFEEAIKSGSLNSAILEMLQKFERTARVYSMAIDDQYVHQGERDLLYPDLQLDEAAVLAMLEKVKE